MEILLLAAFAGLIFWFVFMKKGNIDFWKIASRYPEEAYSFFMENENFLVFDEKPQNGYRNHLPQGNWNGPFKLYVPSKGVTVTIYGRYPGFIDAQNEFAKRYA